MGRVAIALWISESEPNRLSEKNRETMQNADLFKTPLSARVLPNAFQVVLRGGGEPVLRHARGGAYA
jgi:hypothetical protein